MGGGGFCVFNCCIFFFSFCVFLMFFSFCFSFFSSFVFLFFSSFFFGGGDGLGGVLLQYYISLN